MESFDVHEEAMPRSGRISARKSKPPVCPCCRTDQAQHAAKRSQKRKQASGLSPSKVSGDPPKELNGTPPPGPSNPPADIPEALNKNSISPSDLPVVSNVPPSPEPSTAAELGDGPLTFHNCSLTQYQQLNKEVVDGSLRYKSGRRRPYSLQLGRRIKQELWERLNRPALWTSVNEEGRVCVSVSYGEGTHPPFHNVDVSHEPKPQQPPENQQN